MTTIAPAAGRYVSRPQVRHGQPGRFRRLLLVIAVVALPLQDHIPPVAGFSVMYLLFAVLAVVAVVAHPRVLMQAAAHPIFIAGYVLVGLTLLVELVHTNSDLSWWTRMAQMIAGGVIVASYVRTERDLNAVLNGFVIASLWVAVLVVRSSYGVVSSAVAGGYEEASLLRVAALSGLGLKANWNMLALLCASAAGIAAARMILRSAIARVGHAALAVIASMAVFLTFSRSGIIALAVTVGYAFVALLNRKLILRIVLIGSAVLLVLWLAVPRVIFERFKFSFDYDASGNQESRMHLYSTLLRTLPSYAIEGVGSGNYWNTWAYEQGIAYGGDATGAHNTFLQVTVAWGFIGLVTWSALWWIAWHTLSRVTRRQVRYVPFKAFFVAVLLTQLVSHDISDKTVSITLGAIAGLATGQYRAVVARRRLQQSPAVPERPGVS